jgi:hypothetical protein
MQAQNRKNSNSNLKIPGANVDTGSLGVLMYISLVSGWEEAMVAENHA